MAEDAGLLHDDLLHAAATIGGRVHLVGDFGNGVDRRTQFLEAVPYLINEPRRVLDQAEERGGKRGEGAGHASGEQHDHEPRCDALS